MDIFPSQQNLKTLTFDSEKGKWFEIESVVETFNEAIREIDRLKQRNLNAYRQFSKVTKTIDNKKVIPSSSVIQYAYNHRQGFKYFERICIKIDRKIGLLSKSSYTVLDLYKEIAREGIFEDNKIEELLLATVDITALLWKQLVFQTCNSGEVMYIKQIENAAGSLKYVNYLLPYIISMVFR